MAGNAIAEMKECIRTEGLVVIVRGGFTLDDITVIADAMLAAPLRLLEITMNTPAVLSAISALRTRFGTNMVIGAGTVRTATQVQAALDAGAQFLVAPNLDPASVALAQKHETLMLPGVFTPTEAQQAAALGCEMVKLFPCPGPGYLKALRAPLHDLEFIPTGGVDAGNIRTFREAGAVAVGIGSSLVRAGPVDQAALITQARILRQNWHAA